MEHRSQNDSMGAKTSALEASVCALGEEVDLEHRMVLDKDKQQESINTTEALPSFTPQDGAPLV